MEYFMLGILYLYLAVAIICIVILKMIECVFSHSLNIIDKINKIIHRRKNGHI